MTTFLTNDIDANSFMGLVTNSQQKGRRRIFVKVESWEVLRNLAITAAIIVTGLTAGSISQQKMEFSPASATLIGAAV